MQSTKPDFQTAFTALRLKFEAALPERVLMMQQLCDPFSPEQAKLLASEAHKLAGASGTFGHADLGALAKRIEMLVKEMQAKPVEQQQQALALLRSEIASLASNVDKQLSHPDSIPSYSPGKSAAAAVIWIILEESDFLAELQLQLDAFGHQLRVFTNFQQALKTLQYDKPAVLFCATQIAEEGLFEQHALINLLIHHQTPLVIYSEQDQFTLRIKAAQLRALAFFVSPLDIPNIVATLTEVLEQQAKSAGRVAIVEDDFLLAEHYALLLEAAGIHTLRIEDTSRLVEELFRFQPDLVLMDMYMPDYSGPELAGVLRQYPAFKRLPIVFLSSEQNKTLQLQALSHGADDFLTKPIDDLMLVKSVQVRLARAQEIRTLIERDSLTQLIKHSAIKEVANREFERAIRFEQPLSIVMLDIDYFKHVNDSYGHAIGDVVIATLATLLRKRIRKTDRAGRYGGEEFMLVLPDCAGIKAIELVENILALFSKIHFKAGNTEFHCTFSAGVASTSDNSFPNAEQLIEAADKALYIAKRGGRNRVV